MIDGDAGVHEFGGLGGAHTGIETSEFGAGVDAKGVGDRAFFEREHTLFGFHE